MQNREGKTFIEYNCKNGVYSMDGTVVKPLGYLSAITLEKNINTSEKYGDGEVILTLINDKGATGSLELTARDEDFEKDLGFSMDIAQGLADVQIIENKTISVGFECYITDDSGVTKTKKIWLLGVNVSPASESLSQNTDGTNESSASYSMTIKGVYLKTADGQAEYIDSNGNTRKVFKVRSLPNETGYSTFLDSVPSPSMKASV